MSNEAALIAARKGKKHRKAGFLDAVDRMLVAGTQNKIVTALKRKQ
jgi:hypothetical protein